uniref:Uncharacterized protein n=1 Tax=Peronospora matthiolae TaxID=2874970 RepID=A0AAV1TD40_9STRA
MTEPNVRCVVFGHEKDAALIEVLRFLRGFSAVYGSGLSLHTEIAATAPDLEALLTTELQSNVIQVNPRHEHGGLFARISLDKNELVLFGKTAIVDWMKHELLATRYSSNHNRAFDVTSDVPPLRLFISGDRAQVGKSTVCLGLLGTLLQSGYAAKDVAYIKPATQCEKPQLVTKFCRQEGITCCEVGPIVFYKGFTREFLEGKTDASSMQLLDKAKQKIREVGRGKQVVVVDGVGYPAVGSICGVSNAHVAQTLAMPVVLVGKRGVGDAVDSFNLNATFFESHGVKVLGAIFNRLPEDGFYGLEYCRKYVTAYFQQFQPGKHVYGFLPELTDGGHSALDAENTEEDQDESVTSVFLTKAESELAEKVVDAFARRVDVMKLLADVRAYQAEGNKESMGSAKEVTSTA